MRVHVGSILFAYTGGHAEVEAKGTTLRELMDDLETRHPGLRFRVVDEQDRIRPHIRFHLGDRWAEHLDEDITPGAEISILGALSGG